MQHERFFPDIMTMALGLTEPWRVMNGGMSASEKNPERMEVHISVDYREGSKFPCPEYGHTCPVYDSKQKVWKHLNFFQYLCKGPAHQVQGAQGTVAGGGAQSEV